MSVDTNISNLVINKLTKSQYQGITPNANELYFIVDEDEYLPANQGSGNAGNVLTIANDGSVTNSSLKTINNNSLLGSGNITVDSLPSQSGNSGKFLTTNGTTASWATVSGGSLPSQTGNAGKFLTTDGTNASWGEIAAYTANEVETIWNSI